MKRKILSIVLLSVATLLQTALGQPPNPANPDHTLLWKITGNGMTKPGWLFGTMHVLCEDEARLSDSLQSVLRQCEQIYMEIDLSDMSSMLGSIKYMRMNDGKKLSDLMSPESFARVKDYFIKHSPALPFGMLERFKPMLVGSLIEEQRLGCKTTDGMELMMIKYIRQQGMDRPIKGFETVEFQASLFDSIPYELQAKDLLENIDSADKYQKLSKDLAALYLDQDLEKIDALGDESEPAMKGYMGLLLYDRNRRWAEMAGPLLKAKSLLMAVGAAHLPGDKGLISLLRKQGFTLTPVKNEMFKSK